MDLLYDKTHKRLDTFEYKINSGGELNIKETGVISIVFENGKFLYVKYPFSGIYSRNGWQILAAINYEIFCLEYELNKNQPGWGAGSQSEGKQMVVCP